MRRITVDEVKEAYAKTGLKPVRDTKEYLECVHLNKGCPVDALLVSAGGREECDHSTIAKRLRVNASYLCCFVRGVDGSGFSTRTKGYADGRAVAAAIFGEESA